VVRRRLDAREPSAGRPVTERAPATDERREHERKNERREPA